MLTKAAVISQLVLIGSYLAYCDEIEQSSKILPKNCVEMNSFYVNGTAKCIKHSGILYYLMGEKLHRNASETYCELSGGHLASIHSYNENQLIDKDFSLVFSKPFYIGLSPRNWDCSMFNYVWEDGSVFDYHNWQASQSRCCSVAVQMLSGGKWYHADDHLSYFLCKKVINSTFTNSRPSPNTAVIDYTSISTCDKVQEAYAGQVKRCVINQDKLYYKAECLENWKTAQIYCQAYGGDLVSIHSEIENRMLYNLTGAENTWIGMHAENFNCRNFRWLWSDNSTPDYNNWPPGQPHCVDKNFNTATMQKGGIWYASDMGDNNYFLCSKEIHRTTSTASSSQHTTSSSSTSRLSSTPTASTSTRTTSQSSTRIRSTTQPEITTEGILTDLQPQTSSTKRHETTTSTSISTSTATHPKTKPTTVTTTTQPEVTTERILTTSTDLQPQTSSTKRHGTTTSTLISTPTATHPKTKPTTVTTTTKTNPQTMTSTISTSTVKTTTPLIPFTIGPSCHYGVTSCRMEKGAVGCCPVSHGVCCPRNFCCRRGYACDIEGGDCHRHNKHRRGYPLDPAVW